MRNSLHFFHSAGTESDLIVDGMDSWHSEVTFRELNEKEFEDEVLHGQEPALVAFGAQWSKPCQLLKAVLEEIAAECEGRLRIFAVNADDNPDLDLVYEIESIPTVLWFVDGKVRGRIVGFASKQAILSKVSGWAAES